MWRASSDCAEKPKVIVAHVAVVGRARHEGHEQQVGQHVFEREADRDHELERAGGDGVVEERLGHRQVPDAVVLWRKSWKPL
jgi:hypothetical protein